MSSRREHIDECIRIFNESKDRVRQEAKYLPTDKRFESLEAGIISLTEMTLANSKLIDLIVDKLQYLFDKEKENESGN